ncbi:hypothetical protein F11_06245 [Rhodospirillum rubrum F11]|nr:hypothetical protein [Rhodospirillum rubrum]AEO47719.1 hypothetical protein F11_06245 [Rhodospirillum rubrum F11]QXG81663.1 hypothetical protein KUL73_06295 [Rhodospirillum rubrum]
MPAPLRPTILALSLTMPLTLAACGGGEPFLDFYPVREVSRMPMLGSFNDAAVCFSDSTAKDPRIQALAQAHCQEQGKVAQFTSIERMRCTALQPHVAHFACVAASAQPTVAPGAGPSGGLLTAPPPPWESGATAPLPPDPLPSMPTGDPWAPGQQPAAPLASPPGPADSPAIRSEALPPPSVAPADLGAGGASGAWPAGELPILPPL